MTKAAVLYNFGEALAIEALKLRAPNPDEVVVKLAASGVCHSDLSVQQAKLPFPRAHPKSLCQARCSTRSKSQSS